MSYYNHISTSRFYTLIQQRLYEYEEAIFGNRITGNMKLQIVQAAEHNINQIKMLDSQTQILGSGFWGYGINNICDGKETNSHFDVAEIKKINELNKHHENYRILLLLIFKVKGDAFFVSTFYIDSCSVKFNSNINTKFYLKDFDNAEIKVRGNNIFIDFIFRGSEKPISFQIETYVVGGNLSGIELAKYYTDTIKELAEKINSKEIINPLESVEDLNKQINKLEVKLRTLIADTLFVKTGNEDYETLLTGDTKKRIRDGIKKQLDIHPNKTKEDFKSLRIALQFSDIADLKKIILREDYWSFFKFNDKEKVEKYFSQLGEIRNAVKHTREVTELVLLEGKAAMNWLNMIIEL